ncbi:MAG TPA: alanine racemase [Candidatus Aminicenantes bacterium]|nr:alanine racemase [Candidatus Aminicenantes bacterium]HRY66317.1 alanine racemase [Candidatus Aminicenantes bacterium]HRZ73236.1 alanine racemase [Candidatus Aminicenantes bacterium]
MSGRAVQRIEISRRALLHNILEFRRLIGPRRKLLAVVKANAYGHGLLEVAGLAAGRGVDWFGVDSVDEGAALRRAGIQAPVLVLGYAPFDSLEEAVAADLRLTVYNRETVARLAGLAARTGKTVRLHVKVETGTWRQGVAPRDLPAFVRGIRRRPGLVVEGLSSHFANIEDTTRHDYPRRQLGTYRAACRALEAGGPRVPLKHMSCTAAAILFPEPGFNLARVGIGLYGLWPSKETFLSCLLDRKEPLSLEPVLAWKARIAQIKKVPAGADIGYGCTYRTTRPARLAVIPVGYFDGYDRGLSNAAHVLIKGRRAPVRGRVAMDFFMADVTDVPDAALEDEVTLLGPDGRERIAAEDLAALAGTISYEILARLNPLIPRVVV